MFRVFGAAEAKEVFSEVVQVEISALHGLRILFFWSPSTFTLHSLDTVAEARRAAAWTASGLRLGRG